MNPNESPLIPQGSFMEQKNKGRARVKIAVFVVLAIHGIGLMALLMQGCKPSASKDLGSAETNAVGQLADTSLPPVIEDTNVTSLVGSNASTSYVTPAPATNNVTEIVPVAPGAVTEHKIVKGDSFAKLATQYHVTTAAIQEANPGVNSTKLQIGQTIKIPAATTAPTTAVTGGAAPAPTGGSQSYTVKSGDTLIKIGNQFGVTAKAIRTANKLTTDKIRVGQHLTIPVKAGAPVTASTTDAATGATSAPAGTR